MKSSNAASPQAPAFHPYQRPVFRGQVELPIGVGEDYAASTVARGGGGGGISKETALTAGVDKSHSGFMDITHWI